MPFAKKVQTLIYDEGSSAWINGSQVVITKNSIAAAVEPASAIDKTSVMLNDGSTLRVNQTLQQIEDFLNS